MRTSRALRVLALAGVAAAAFLGGGVSHILAQATCGPFTDVPGNLCPSVLEIYTLGITTGTSATTYSPDNTVTRGQMARFLTRTVDQLLPRGSRRAALDQSWTPMPAPAGLGVTTVGMGPALLTSDGADVWVPSVSAGTVSRVRASDGKLLETWNGATLAYGALVAMGRVLVSGFTSPGALYMIDPSQAPGTVTTVASNLGNGPRGITFDGAKIWTANNGGSVSIITPGTWLVTNVTMGFTGPQGALFDGSNVWVTDAGDNSLKKLDGNGVILQSIPVGAFPGHPVFDGANIWVPNVNSNTVTVVRASTGAVLETLSGNGLTDPLAAAFDGQRILVTNVVAVGTVSLFRATDLAPLGSFPASGGSQPYGACSDGVSFWISFNNSATIARL